jgi:Mannosyl-glycoprotein endo-beta-N-acetylglucosaminidase
VRRLLILLIAAISLVVAPAAQARSLFDLGGNVDDLSTVPTSRLPAWVQVNSAAAPIYASDTGSALAGSNLSRYTFLHVLVGGSSRLQVDVYDEGAQTTRGWVDADNVVPSAPGIGWRVAAVAAPLFRAADTTADAVRTIDRFSPLQQVGDPVEDRIEVRVFRSDFTVLDQGWVDRAATGPAFAPPMHVPQPEADRPLGARLLSPADQPQAFLEAIAQAARTAAAQTGVPASVTVAQAILESDWGRSLLAQNANNYFGIKSMGGLGSDGVVWMPTSEYDDQGQEYQTVSAFRAYRSLADSLIDHDLLLQTASRYAPAMRASNDPRQFARLLSQAGYSTDPAYSDKLVALMDSYDLYRLDA